MKKKKKSGEKVLRTPKCDRFLLIAAAVFLFGLTVWGILMPDRDFSENENRTLHSFPALTWKSVMNGEFEQGLSDYLSDQFPLRDLCVSARALCETALGKGQNNGVIAGEDGYVFAREDYPSLENLQKNLASIASFAAVAKEQGIPTSLCVAGRKIDVETEKLPTAYGRDSQDTLWAEIDARAKALPDVTYANLRDALCGDTGGNPLYYRTDHHWTTYGAYTAYRAVLRTLPYAPHPRARDWFEEEKVSDAFYGTTWSKSGMTWHAGDDLVYLRFPGDEDITVTFVGEDTAPQGLYDRSYLSVKDKYASFLSGNHAFLQIRGNADPTRGRLLVIKDSFAHSLVPFLAADYDLDVLDLRYYKGIPARLLTENSYDAVLILCASDLLTDDAEPLNFALLGLK